MFRYLTAGESHGPQLTAVVDGFPAGLTVDVGKINDQLARRQKGFGRGDRMKIEKDQVQILSGMRHGVTLGSPITLVIDNKDWVNWESVMHPTKSLAENLSPKQRTLAFKTTRPRPGHADLAGAIKLDRHDLRDVLERASARETAARVAVGSLARQLLEYFKIEFASHVIRIGSVELKRRYSTGNLTEFSATVEKSEVRCVDKITGTKMIEAIENAQAGGESLGGVVEIIVRGLPVGLGAFSQWDRRLDSRLAAAMMALPSVKGMEIGPAFKSAGKVGSQVQDEIFYKAGSNPVKKDFYRKTNHAGGLEGGMTNGEDLVIRLAAKPLSTLKRPLQTVDIVTKRSERAIVERTDSCVIPALAVVAEAAAAIVCAQAFLEKFSSDNLGEMERHYQTYLDRPF